MNIFWWDSEIKKLDSNLLEAGVVFPLLIIFLVVNFRTLSTLIHQPLLSPRVLLPGLPK